jgi:hypothetical protein
VFNGEIVAAAVQDLWPRVALIAAFVSPTSDLTTNQIDGTLINGTLVFRRATADRTRSRVCQEAAIRIRYQAAQVSFRLDEVLQS